MRRKRRGEEARTMRRDGRREGRADDFVHLVVGTGLLGSFDHALHLLELNLGVGGVCED